ncbi:biogenesis of lysosome-related organelles complex 1 subunit 5 isoform X3 [Alligator mississippiensis]|uniref:biogenesis of lysosome-related organelles complex 1 subunit 5 isoform X3 n=1 Tax=Alligator mississippiensis TaxID=8496 RepID=UPI002877576E|nr:biogenesis of lysosome-related organelles complex 1 subunit 5 isoform X3 [Alligator mississippiensis]
MFSVSPPSMIWSQIRLPCTSSAYTFLEDPRIHCKTTSFQSGKILALHLLCGNRRLLPSFLMWAIWLREKRGLRELRVLESLKNMIYETNNQILPKCEQVMHDSLNEAFKRLQAASQRIHKLQEREQGEREKATHSCLFLRYRVTVLTNRKMDLTGEGCVEADNRCEILWVQYY